MENNIINQRTIIKQKYPDAICIFITSDRKNYDVFKEDFELVKSIIHSRSIDENFVTTNIESSNLHDVLTKMVKMGFKVALSEEVK